MIFEEYEFSSYYRCTREFINTSRINEFQIHIKTYFPAASLIPYGQVFSSAGLPPPQCSVIVDSGFSFTHVVPIIDGVVIWKAVKRYVKPSTKLKRGCSLIVLDSDLTLAGNCLRIILKNLFLSVNGTWWMRPTSWIKWRKVAALYPPTSTKTWKHVGTLSFPFSLIKIWINAIDTQSGSQAQSDRARIYSSRSLVKSSGSCSPTWWSRDRYRSNPSHE